MKVAIITVGDEILIGQIVDTNSAWMAEELNQIGAEIVQITSVGDDKNAIIQAIAESLKQAEVVLMTGGLGPTRDDITKTAIAEFLGVGMYFDQPTYDRILKLFERWGRSSTPEHREQCYMPESAELLFNKMGTAPGMWFSTQDKVLVSMPGVPYEMKYLMKERILPKLRDTFPARPLAHRTVRTVGEGESRIANRLKAFEDGLPDYIKLAFLPSLGQVRLRLTGKGPDLKKLERELDQKVIELKSYIPELVYGEGALPLEEAVGLLLRRHDLRLATAESCTGGYISHLITRVPGSSDYYLGSVIAYSNTVKINQLKVRLETLETHGAVSEHTVREMVQGALKLLQTDLAVAISGIAGPGGGSPDKPVGTVWIAVGNAQKIDTYMLKAGKDRLKNIEYSAIYALDQIRKFILANYGK